MSVPGFNEPFDSFYDQYSIHRLDFYIPDHFDVYEPDWENSKDFQCLSVIAPNPTKGATKWIYKNRWFTVGVYRDEGRKTQQRPPVTGLSWSRTATLLTMIDPNGHKLRVGDAINLYNVNLDTIEDVTVFSVINANQFTVKVPYYGASSGSIGAYQAIEPYNFAETNYVFRLLPSMKLITWDLLNQFMQDSAPPLSAELRQLYNFTTDEEINVPRGISKSVNYEVKRIDPYIENNDLVRFNQIYDESGNPIRIEYKEDGTPVDLNNYDEYRLFDNRAFNSLEVNAETDFIKVYDFYGLLINDELRGPYYRNDLITRDEDVQGSIDNITRAEQNGVPYYDGNLYDIFGNFVIGIQPNNATVIRQNLLPLKLDRFNRPVKSPKKYVGKL